MLVRYFVLVLPSWLLIPAMIQAGECDKCVRMDQQSRCCSESQCTQGSCSCDEACCNDSGLLDVVDRFAGRIHYGFLQFSRRVQPGCCSNRSWQAGSRCDECCDSSFTAQDHVSSKRSRSRTSCDACDFGKYQDGKVNTQEHSSEAPPATEDQTSRSRLRQFPTRQRVPDSEVDPFQDDPQTSLHPVPSRNNRYQRLLPLRTGKNETSVLPLFDSQANWSPLSAEYWNDDEWLGRDQGSHVTVVSSESAAPAEQVKKPYRVRVGDQEEASQHQEKSAPASPLRPTVSAGASSVLPDGDQALPNSPQKNPLR